MCANTNDTCSHDAPDPGRHKQTHLLSTPPLLPYGAILFNVRVPRTESPQLDNGRSDEGNRALLSRFEAEPEAEPRPTPGLSRA